MKTVAANWGVILLMFLVLSCSEETETVNDQFRKVGTVELPLPEDCVPQTLAQKIFEHEENEFLFWLSRENHAILMYDLEEESLKKRIHLTQEGPNRIPKVAGGLSVLGFDSIFLSTHIPGKLFRIDTSGRLLEHVVYADPEKDSATLNDLSSLNSNIHSDLYQLSENKLIVPLRIPYFKSYPGQSVLNQIALFKKIQPGQPAQASLFNLPAKIYQEGHPHRRAMSTAFHHGTLYFTIECDQHIFKTTDLKKLESIPAASRYPEDFRPLDNGEHPFVRFTRSFSYRSLFWDPYRELFYRFVKLPVMDELSNYEREFRYPSKFSIIVFDHKLEKLGEILYSNTGYSMVNCFVGKKGLYLMRSPYHEAYKENYLTFDLFEFSRRDGLQKSTPL